MAKQVKIRALVNKGRHGVPLDKFPKILAEFRQFLKALSEDLGIDDSQGWQGVEFKETGSLEFAAVSNVVVEDATYSAFNDSALHVILNEPDERISRKTRYQYSRIASPIDPDESVSIGIEVDTPETEIEGEPLVAWHELTKQRARLIELSVSGTVTAIASVQGIIHSVFIEADRPHFQMRELSSADLITCNYRESKYGELAEAVKHRKAVIHVTGTSLIDTLSNKILSVEVDEIIVAPNVGKDFLERFVGSAPGLVSDINKAMDKARRREREN